MKQIQQVSIVRQGNRGIWKLRIKGLLIFALLHMILTMPVLADSFEIGGSINGLTSMSKVVCVNKNTEDKVVIDESDSDVWNCDAVALSVIEGHKIKQKITGRVASPEQVGGTVVGIGEILSVKCENRTQRNKIYINRTNGNSWNCSDAGLYSESGDKVKQTVIGFAKPSIVNLPPLTPMGIRITVGDGQLTLSWEPAVNADFYKIYSKFGNNILPSDPVFIGDTTLPTFTHSGLINGISYSYVIVASNNYGDSRPSVSVSGIPVQVLFSHESIPAGSCVLCHNNIDEQGKGPAHIVSTEACEACHTTSAWITANIDHSQVTGQCASCHSKPAFHLTTSDVCDACHATNVWAPVVSIDHTQVFGACSSCHNGAAARGKTATHPLTSSLCDTCHLTTAWLPTITVDHSQIFGACENSGCHAFDKPNAHVPTSNQCDVCHTVVSWVPVSIDHSKALGACSSCHTLPLGHINVTTKCEACHQTTFWLPVTNNKVDHGQVLGTCALCHSLSVSHPVTTFVCENCHNSSQFPAWLPTTVDHNEVLGSCSTCHTVPQGHCSIFGIDCNTCHTVTNWLNQVSNCVNVTSSAVGKVSPAPGSSVIDGNA